MERYIFRNESNISEPGDNPIQGILLDTKLGKYYLLDRSQSEVTLAATRGITNEGRELNATQPFPLAIKLEGLFNNTRILDLDRKQLPNILSAPLSVYLEIASKCNLSCKDCYQGKRESKTDTLSEEDILKLLQRLSELGVFGVRFTGKEPTTHPRLLEFVKIGRTLGLKMAMNTNGYFDEEYCLKLIDSGIQEIVISIDGNREWNDSIRGNGVYKKATSNLKSLISAGIDTRINSVVSKGSLNYIEDVARLANKSKSFVSYIPIRKLGNVTSRMQDELLQPSDMKFITEQVTYLRSKYAPTRLLTYFDILGEEADYYHPMFQMRPCHSRKYLFIDNKGDVYPCDHLVGLGKLYSGGNIRQVDLLDIWRSGEGLVRYRLLDHSPRCKNCEHFGKQCNGGCCSEGLVACKGETAAVEDELCFYKTNKRGINTKSSL